MPEPRRLFAWLLCLALALPAQAQQREAVQSDLADTMEALESASKTREELEQRNKKLEKELSNLQRDLVSITGKVQKQEKRLSGLEANLLHLQDEEREKTRRLERRKAEQAAMVQTMLKLSRVPPAAVVAMPGDFATTLRTAKVLGLTTTALTHQAGEIAAELTAIHQLQERITRNHAAISRQKRELQKDGERLQAKLDTRAAIHDTLLSRYAEQKKEVQRLSRESGNLRELMSGLEKQRIGAEKLAVVPEFKPASSAPPAQGGGDTTRFAAAQGKIALPAEGTIFVLYGETASDGGESRGISIRTRAGAQVTSPFAGEVAYTGTFLDYGNMVILRHDGGYHSLLAGMEQVSARLGQKVLKGEPIGEMGRAEEKTALYMEIRKDNRPVDPMPWLDQTQQYATKRQLLR